MRKLFAFLAVVALFVCRAQAADPVPTPGAQPAIHIYSCKVLAGQPLVPGANRVGLAVRFQNQTPDVYKTIVWRAKFGAGYVDFIDEGEFSPQIKIDNFLLTTIGKSHVNIIGALLSVRGAGIPVESEVRFPEYASLDDPENCEIIKAVTQDDESWTAANVTNDHYLLPSPYPSTEATLAPGEEIPAAPVDVAHCHVLFPQRRNTAQVDVGYRITSPGKTADTITFRVSYGRGNFDVNDQGAFTSEDYVRHKLKAPMPDDFGGISYFAFDDPHNCVATTVHYSDGTQWTNPSAPAPQAAPTKVPDALDFGLGEWAVNWKMTREFPAPTASPSATPPS